MKNTKYLLLGIAAVVCAAIVGRAYTYKYRAQDTILVTGLGEAEFTSDLIVWSGEVTAEAQQVAAGYAQIEKSKQKVQEYLAAKGVSAGETVFAFVNVEKQYDPIYNANGNWAGQRFAGYRLRQRFTVESADVEKVETVSREISSLIAQGVSIEAYAPDYYYTKLDDVKMGLIEKASADARTRAEKIALNAGTKIGRVASARMGVFPDHRSQHQRGIFGRRLVQHLLAPEEGAHHHANRIQNKITRQDGKTRSGAFRTQPHRTAAHRRRPHGIV